MIMSSAFSLKYQSENSITKEEKRTDIRWQSNNQYLLVGRRNQGTSGVSADGIVYAYSVLAVARVYDHAACCSVIQLCSQLFSSPWCGGLKNGSSEIYVVIPGSCEYITWDGRRNFEDVIKLRILRWGDFPRLSGITRVFCSGHDPRSSDWAPCPTSGLAGSLLLLLLLLALIVLSLSLL